MLKNQAYYRLMKDSMWNDPVHAGRQTWSDFHAPRIEKDARLAQKLDEVDDKINTITCRLQHARSSGKVSKIGLLVL